MLLMVEKGIRGGMCHAFYRYVKAMINWKIIIEIKNHHNLRTGTEIVCMDGQFHKSYL